MSRTRTKRIAWAIAVLVALSFVAAMVLHKHEEPKIVGTFSAADVKEITDLSLRSGRHLMRGMMRFDLKSGELKSLIPDARAYASLKVTYIEALRNGECFARLKAKGYGSYIVCGLIRTNEHWKTDYAISRSVPATNSAPVSRSGAVK